MDDQTAARVWAEFRERVPTTGVSEAATLIGFTQWVQEKAGVTPPDAPKSPSDEPAGEEGEGGE